MLCCRQLRQKRRWLPICHAFRSMSRSCRRLPAKRRRRRSKLCPLRLAHLQPRQTYPRRRSSMQRAPGLHNSCVIEQRFNPWTDPLRNLNRRRIVVRRQRQRRRRPLRCASPVRRVSLSAHLPAVKHRRRNPLRRRTAVPHHRSTARRLRGWSACAPMPAIGRRQRRRQRPLWQGKERRRKSLRRRFRDWQNRFAMTESATPGRRVPSSPLMPLLLSAMPGRMFRRSNRPSRLPTCPPMHLREFHRRNRLHLRMIPHQHSPRRPLSRQHRRACWSRKRLHRQKVALCQHSLPCPHLRQHRRACRRQARLRRRTAVLRQHSPLRSQLRQHRRACRRQARLRRRTAVLRQYSPLRSQLRQHCRTRRSRVRLHRQKVALRQHSPLRSQLRQHCRTRRSQVRLRCRKAVLRQHSLTRLRPRRDRRARRRKANLRQQD